jgi:1-acyl-sn-glycerol-3-phosphate acyltransferase
MRLPRPLQALRSLIVLLLLLVWLPLGGVLQRLIVWPAVILFPSRRYALVSAFMRLMSRGIFSLLQLGGARFKRQGALPTTQPCLVLMNHQSLLDITTIVMLAAPLVPAFATRRRYQYGVPCISPCLRLLGCPIVDPQADTRGSVAAIEQAARRHPAGLVIFPEGNRSRDGRVRPFKTAGCRAALVARPMPVYLVVTDGFVAGRRLVDFLFKVGEIRGETEVLGPYTPPLDPGEHAAFVRQLRDVLVARLEERRGASAQA